MYSSAAESSIEEPESSCRVTVREPSCDRSDGKRDARFRSPRRRALATGRIAGLAPTLHDPATRFRLPPTATATCRTCRRTYRIDLILSAHPRRYIPRRLCHSFPDPSPLSRPLSRPSPPRSLRQLCPADTRWTSRRSLVVDRHIFQLLRRDHIGTTRVSMGRRQCLGGAEEATGETERGTGREDAEEL